MSESFPERADIRQLRTQAKELLRDLRLTNPDAKLADAQRELARKHGFSSWPRLVADVEVPALLEKLKLAVETADSEGLERLLKSKPALRKRVDAPVFDFDSPASVWLSSRPWATQMLPILLRYGADPNVRTSWWAGGFSILDYAKGPTVELMLSLGAQFDVWSAAAHGRLDVLRELLDADPSSVNAPGGDGERPIHFAANAEVAELLIARGADLEVRDLDHEATPIQYQVNNPEVLRVLLAHGAKPDIFTAVVLNDVALLQEILREDASATEARVGFGEFVTRQSNGGHIYAYKLGSHRAPHQIAAERGHQEVLAELMALAPPLRQLIMAAWLGKAEEFARLLAENPGITEGLGEEAAAITHAAHVGRLETVRMLLDAGWDPLTPGMGGGSALHVAAFYGHTAVVKLLAGRVPLDLRDPVHGGTPLSWALYGGRFSTDPKVDYVGTVEALLEAGANPHETANSNGTSMLEQAGTREDLRAVLRRFGAV